MLKLQQEQLYQRTQGFSHLQAPNSHNQSPHYGHVIRQRCQRPGHFARECDGGPSAGSRQSRPSQQWENQYPPSYRATAWLGSFQAQMLYILPLWRLI